MSMYFLSPAGKYSSKLKVINPLLATLLTNTSSILTGVVDTNIHGNQYPWVNQPKLL